MHPAVLSLVKLLVVKKGNFNLFVLRQMSTEADDDDMEEVEFISVSQMFQKFKMHHIKRPPVC